MGESEQRFRSRPARHTDTPCRPLHTPQGAYPRQPSSATGSYQQRQPRCRPPGAGRLDRFPRGLPRLHRGGVAVRREARHTGNGQVLDIGSPWGATGVEIQLQAGKVEVFVALRRAESYRPPAYGGSTNHPDSRRRGWRHPPRRYRTLLTADVPQVQCARLGCEKSAFPGRTRVHLSPRYSMPWPSTTWARQTHWRAARPLDPGWDQVSGVKERAVDRRLERRATERLPRI